MFDPAAVVADDPLTPDQYRFVGTRAWWIGSGGPASQRYCYLAEHVLAVWVPAHQRNEWLLDRRTDDGREPGPLEAWWQQPAPDFLAGLPRDPRLLYERLQSDSPADRPGYCGAFTYAADALRTGLVPADLRAALYRALLMIPEVRLAEAEGREAGSGEVSLGLDDGVHLTEIFISSSGGQFSGERSRLTHDTRELKAGSVTTSTVVQVSKADRIGQWPAGK